MKPRAARGFIGGLCLIALLANASPLLAQAPNIRAVEVRLRQDVTFLTDPKLEGRGAGTAGLEEAGKYIERQFEAAGLAPAGDGGGWRQDLDSDAGGDSNVLGRLRGAGATAGATPGATAGEAATCLVLGAHFDHLGRDGSGAIFAGADDNASGVAILLEVARRLAEETAQDGSMRPARDILFVAFAGEETGLLGSRAYVARPACPLEETVAMINLDTVGRLQGGRLFAIGAGSALEWDSMLKGVAMAAGIQVDALNAGPFASDQVPFFERGVPVLHLFTGPNADYHRAADTAEKLDYAGMSSTADLVTELLLYLTDRPGRLTFVPPGAAEAKPQSSSNPAPRRVSLGTIPDFSRESGGVLLSGVMPGSPAEGAGFQKGDVLVELDGESLDTLADFTDVLKRHAPGDSVVVVVDRAGQRISRTVQLAERK